MYNKAYPMGYGKENKNENNNRKAWSAMEFGGTKKDIVLLIISAFSLLASIFRLPLQFLRQGYIIS